MSEQPGDDVAEPPVPSSPSVEKRLRRTALSTGFSEVPGRICEVCGYQGFRWQKECPRGHPLG